MSKLLTRYMGLVSDETLLAVGELARELADRSILHVYSGRLRSDVRDMVSGLGRLFEDVGLQFRAAAMVGTEEVFDVVRRTGEPLESDGKIPERWRVFYEDAIRESARKMFLSSDLVVIHGLQPLGLIRHRRGGGPWVWRCHGDISNAASSLWGFARNFVSRYQASIFSHARFVPDLKLPHFIIPPSVDPFAPVNRPMPRQEVDRTLAGLGVPAGRPIALQFLTRGTVDEALGAIRTWKRSGARDHALLALVEVGQEGQFGQKLSASDQDALRAVDRSVYLIHADGDSEDALCALGRAASVAIDVSGARWPNLHLLDAMWKSCPAVVASGSAAAALVPEGAGVHVSNEDDLSRTLGDLLGGGEELEAMRQAAHDAIGLRHLLPRHVLDYLKLMLHYERDAARA